MAASSIVKYRDGLATLSFSGHSRHGSQESLCVVGTHGVLRGTGTFGAIDRLTFTTATTTSEIPTPGTWFPDGFCGALGELLSAIEDDREPSHGARGNLASLALCFAAMKSADTGLPQVPETY